MLITSAIIDFTCKQHNT